MIFIPITSGTATPGAVVVAVAVEVVVVVVGIVVVVVLLLAEAPSTRDGELPHAVTRHAVMTTEMKTADRPCRRYIGVIMTPGLPLFGSSGSPCRGKIAEGRVKR